MPLLTFLIAVAFVPGIPSYESAGRWAVIAIGGAVLLWRVRVYNGPGHLLGMFLVAYCAESVLWSATPLDTLGQTFQLICLGTVFCVAAYEKDLASTFDALALGLIPSLVVGVFQYFGYAPVRAYTINVPGLFLSSNYMATIAAVSVLGSLAYKRYWYAVPGVLLVVMNPSREAYVALAIVMYLWMFQRLPFHSRVSFVIGTFGVLVLGYVFLLYDFNHAGGWSRLSSVNDRLVFWQLGLANITPLGYGLGSSVELWPQFEHFHNEYIEYAFELGFGAFAALGVITYALCSRNKVRWAFIGLLVTAAFNFNFHEPMCAYLVAVMAGFLVGDCDRSLGLQPVRRVIARLSLVREESLGVGSLFPADLRRQLVPTRSKYSHHS